MSSPTDGAAPPPSDDARNGAAASTTDLAVLLTELNRIRETDEDDAHSPGEAMTLAAAAVRMVEAQLGRAGPDGLGPPEIATAREALQAALDALQTAVEQVEGDAAGPAGRRFRMRRRGRTVASGRS